MNHVRYIAMGDMQGEAGVLGDSLEFIRDFKPEAFIVGGDFLDFDAICSFNRHKRVSKGLNSVLRETRDEIMVGRKMLDDIRAAVGPKCEIVFMVGNHEERLESFFDEYPQLFTEYTTLEGALELKKRGIKLIEQGGFYRLGKLYFMHGEKYGSDLFTKNAALKCRKNVRLFHHHTNQSYMITSELDGNDKIEVKSCGCMCGMAPSYLKGQQNRWINSFFAGYVLPSGDYQDFTISMFNGKFIGLDGKVYGGNKRRPAADGRKR